MRINRFLAPLFAAVVLFAAGLCLAQEEKPADKPQGGQEEKSELLRYVEKEDKAYKWEKTSKQEMGDSATVYLLELTSQTWQKITWRHGVHVVVPKELKKKPTHVFLLIVGSGRARGELIIAGQIAGRIGAPVAVLYDIPNQPLFGRLYEDSLIAHTFLKYMETKDPTWPLLFPMVKGAVRAMDAIEEFLKKEHKAETAGFVVSGASKRGWTTWLTAAVDRRVKAIAPMVYDNLDLVAQMKHQKETWGKFSEMIAPYTRHNIPQLLLDGSEDALKLSEMVDPFTYRDRITVPKLILIGTNDKYWPLDAANLYWDKLKGEKYLLYMPNAGHGLNISIFSTIMAFFKKTRGELKFPDFFKWKFRGTDPVVLSLNYRTEKIEPKAPRDMKEGDIPVTITEVGPKEVRLWVADSSTKDFRKAEWKQDHTAKGVGIGSHGIMSLDYTIKRVAGAFIGVFAELVYEKDGLTYSLCTNVKIFPPPKEEEKEKPQQEK